MIREMELLFQASRTSPMLHEAAVTVEEGIAALRTERDELVIQNERLGNDIVAAEARCARLQQALDALKAEVPRYLTTLRETLGNELSDDWRTPANRTCREYAARQALRALDELEERLGAYRDALQAAEHNECEHDWVREHGDVTEGGECDACGSPATRYDLDGQWCDVHDRTSACMDCGELDCPGPRLPANGPDTPADSREDKT